MKLTAQEEYGLRCLLQIARAPQGFATIKDIAAAEALTTPYVAKLLRQLRLAGLVKSTRGLKGGYQLVLPIEQLSVGSVLSSMGGLIYSNSFCKRYSGTKHVCVHHSDCAMRPMWRAIDQVVQRALDHLPLKELLGNEHSMLNWIERPREVSAS